MLQYLLNLLKNKNKSISKGKKKILKGKIIIIIVKDFYDMNFNRLNQQKICKI